METSQPIASLLNRTSQWPWRATLVVAIAPLLLGLALWTVHQESTLSLLYGWLKMGGNGDDSWGPMKAAVDLAVSNKESIYEELFFRKQLKFQYPPSSLLFHELLVALNIDPTPGLLNRLNWFLVLANASIAAWFGISLARQLKSSAPSPYGPVPVGSLCFVAALCFYPVVRAYSLGQAQIWIDVLFTLSCTAWLFQKRLLTGALVGLICLIKPQFSLFFLWGLLRGQKQFVYGWLAVVLSGSALSIQLFGLLNHLDYLTVLTSLSRTGESFHGNQSINGILNRLLDNGPVIAWQANSFPAYNALVRWGTLLSSGAIIVGVLLYRRREKPGLLDFQLAALAFTMASPIAWEHHYGILPLIYVAAYFALQGLRDEEKRRLGYWALALSYLLTANYLGTAVAIAKSPLNILYSYLFVGAALLVLVLWTLMAADPAGRGRKV